MGFVNQILCILQAIMDQLFAALNGTLGGILGVELTPPGLGCVSEEPPPA